MKKLIAIFCIMLLAVFTFAACSSKKKVRKNKLKTFASAKLPILSSMPHYMLGLKKDFLKMKD